MDEKPTARTSRRALLAAAGGAAAALAAESLVRPLPAAAVDDRPLILGQANTAGKETSLEVHYADAHAQNALSVRSLGLSSGISVEATGGDAMRASGTGINGRGLWAFSDEDQAINAATHTGTGVYASGGTGYALYTSGKVGFDASGLGTVPKGKSRAVVTPLAGGVLHGSPRVLVTLMSDPGAGVLVKFVQVDAIAGTFAVNLTAKAKSNTRFAYFVISG